MSYSKSDSIIELAKALAKAQGEIENATTYKVNPHFKSNYADLSAVLAEIREAFSPNGLSLTQMPFNDANGNVGIESILMHQSGEWICSSVSCKPNKTDAPALGSVLTYLRRYSASAIAGIAQEDDDGGAPSNSTQDNQSKEPKLDDNAKTWIAIVKEDPSRINEIDDAEFKAFIKKHAGVN